MRVLKRRKIRLDEKQRIINELKRFLATKNNILFTYLYGSFLEGTEFNDIDIGIYFDINKFKAQAKLFNYSINFSTRIEDVIKKKTGDYYEMDVHPLNIAPLSFKFAVITQGELIFSRDQDKRVDFEVITRDLYFDFMPHFEYYYKVAILEEDL